jgi:hypothetical protein
MCYVTGHVASCVSQTALEDSNFSGWQATLTQCLVHFRLFHNKTPFRFWPVYTGVHSFRFTYSNFADVCDLHLSIFVIICLLRSSHLCGRAKGLKLTCPANLFSPQYLGFSLLQKSIKFYQTVRRHIPDVSTALKQLLWRWFQVCMCVGRGGKRHRNKHEVEIIVANFNDENNSHKQKQTPWPLVRERTIPTERPPLVDEI